VGQARSGVHALMSDVTTCLSFRSKRRRYAGDVGRNYLSIPPSSIIDDPFGGSGEW